jgi:HSP20 family protein
MALIKTNRYVPKKKDMRKDLFESLFDDLYSDWDMPANAQMRADFSPSMNIKEENNHYMIEAELPGMKKEDINIDFKDKYLILSGEKKSFDEDKRDNYHHVERRYGSFYRTVRMPDDVDKEKISAEYKNGVLHVDLAKCEKKSMEHKKIEIK